MGILCVVAVTGKRKSSLLILSLDRIHSHSVILSIFEWFEGALVAKYTKQAGTELCQAQLKLASSLF